QLGLRKGEMTNMVPDGKGRLRLDYTIPARGLIGFRNTFLTMTSGTGILTSTFSHYGPIKEGTMGSRQNGVLVSMA
ncbi:MAG TPA: translational GTPase TypA, partial [Marinobacter sp.]|nr:translational GTPase TypA [Marinobacter sp.]